MWSVSALSRGVPKAFRAATLSALVLALLLAPTGYTQEAAGLEGIRAAYQGILELFYRPLDPRNVLQSGWSQLRSNAEQRGESVPDSLPDLPSDVNGAFAVFANAYSGYVGRLPSSSATAAAADIKAGIAASAVEQHTNYLPPESLQRFLAVVAGGQVAIGLGIGLRGDPPGLVTDVAPGGPAAAAGIQAGDVIVGADGKDLSNVDRSSLASALGGAEGTPVTLSVDRGSGARSVKITRGPYYFPPLESRVLPGGFGYVRLADFTFAGTNLPNGTELLSDLDRRLDELDAAGIAGLVLDLRNNSGGSVQTADELLGRFLPDTAQSIHEYDQRGHEAFDLASGLVRARQVPMAVLINGGSASASEITAAVLQDAHRAVVVGQRSAGVVAASILVPLPSGDALQIAVAGARAGGSSADLDGVGVTPDVSVAGTRTLADYRSGFDAQLDAAVSSLARAPAAPPVSVPQAPLTTVELDRLLENALPGSAELPTNDRLTVTNRWQRLDFVHPNQLINQNGGSPDPIELQQLMRTRGYQGSVLATYGAAPGNLPSVTINADLYATSEGAHTAASTNDVTVLWNPRSAPTTVGDETAAYQGVWMANGSTLLTWRRGRVVISVTYSDVPGIERPDTVAAITRLVDARAQHLPVSP